MTPPAARELPPAVLDTLRFAPFPTGDLHRVAIGQSPDVRLIETPDAFIRIRTAGTGPETVLLSDGPSTIEHYDQVLSLLSGPHRRVHIMEIPGFGFSWAKRPEALTYDGTVHAVQQALDQLLIGPAIIGGICVQAHVALSVANTRGDLCRGLVLSQATGWDQTRAWCQQIIDPTGVLARPWQGQALWRTTREHAAIDGWYPAAAAEGYDVSAWQEIARTVHHRGASNSLPTLTQTWYDGPCPFTDTPLPTVLQWGGADRTHLRAGSDPWALAKHLSDPLRVLEPGGGHFLDLERPDRLEEALVWLDR